MDAYDRLVSELNKVSPQPRNRGGGETVDGRSRKVLKDGTGKECTGCWCFLPWGMFVKDKSRKDGHCRLCVNCDCLRKHGRLPFRRNASPGEGEPWSKERKAEYHRAWRRANHEKCMAAQRRYREKKRSLKR